MTTTNSSLIVEVTPAGGPDDLWIECRECGKANYQSKGPINHKRGCRSSRAQYVAVPATANPIAAPITIETGSDLREFAANVRRTGLTKGRDADVLQAVRDGYLSESDAMNADD